MNTHKRPRNAKSLLAAAVASTLIVAGGVALAPAANAAPPTAPTVDYFADSFAGLRTGSVFTPVTFERFERLLDSDGTYAFLIGGPADGVTAATVASIDQAAQAHGIDTVYAFDPRLDGKSLDIRTTSSAPLKELYTRLVEKLNKDTNPQFGDPTTDPTLFIYDRSHTASGVEDRIVGSVTSARDAENIDPVTFSLDVDALFASVPSVDTQSQFTFFHDAMNQRHTATYADASLFGGDVLTADDGANFVLQSVTYPELVNLLESDGEHVILFGGTWCHNTRALVKEVNRAAAASGVKTVYVFDLKLDGLSNAPAHIRDSASEYSYLYGDLVAKYLPNLRTQYVPAVSAGQRVEYYPGGDTGAERAVSLKLQVPYLISYNKAAGNAPITKDWLHENADGSFTEYMTEFWWVAGLPGKNSRNLAPEVWAAQQQTNWAFAAEAVAKLDGFFGLATAPDAPAAPTATASASGDVTVTWAAPANGGSALTGFDVALDGGAAVTVAANATSHVFGAVAPGTHSVTVAAVNHLGSARSTATTVTVTAPPVVPAVAVTGDLRPGGTISVSGTGFAAGAVSVELHSTPQVLGSATAAAGGGFTLTATIPANVPAGAHAVVVFANGLEVARTAVTVAPAAAGGGTGDATAGASGQTARGLAGTGGPGIPYLALGTALLLVLAGAGTLVARRARS